MRCYTEIDGIQVDSKILTEKFCCDYEKCKGACCYQHIPGVELNGGALSDYDAAEILLHRKELSLLCDKDDQQIAREQPVSKDGDNFYTTLKKEKCVFSSMCRGTCVLKIAKGKKIGDIDIPLSCQLYPIVWEVYPTYERLRVENIYDEICVCGYEKGKRENVFLLDFMKVPLIRGLGEEFFSKMKEVQKDFI